MSIACAKVRSACVSTRDWTASAATQPDSQDSSVWPVGAAGSEPQSWDCEGSLSAMDPRHWQIPDPARIHARSKAVVALARIAFSLHLPRRIVKRNRMPRYCLETCPMWTGIRETIHPPFTGTGNEATSIMRGLWMFSCPSHPSPICTFGHCLQHEQFNVKRFKSTSGRRGHSIPRPCMRTLLYFHGPWG